jgi:hypothetical protein
MGLSKYFFCYHEIINVILSNKECDGKNEFKKIIIKLREDHLANII